MKPITWDIYPAPIKEALFLSLGEGKTVLAFGYGIFGGQKVRQAAIYRSFSDGTANYAGWSYMKGNPVQNLNGFFYHKRASGAIVGACPVEIIFLAEVDPCLADESETNKSAMLSIVNLLGLPIVEKNKAN